MGILNWGLVCLRLGIGDLKTPYPDSKSPIGHFITNWWYQLLVLYYEDKCEDSAECKGSKLCQKRHHKACKRYNSERGCKFGNECAYSHENSVKLKEPKNELEQ